MKSFHPILPALCAAAILLVLPMTACSSAVRAEHTDSSPVAPREIPDENGSDDHFRIPLPRELPGIHRQAPGKPAMPHPPEDGRFRKGKGKHHEMPAPDSSQKKTRMRTIPKRNSQILPHGPARENGMLLRNITERPAVPDITENRRTTRIRIPPEQKTLLPETCPKPCLTTDKPKKPSARPSRKTETYAKNSRARSANERARTAYFKSLFYINLRISE